MAVLLVATGGTIASRPTPEGVRASLTGAELLERAGIGGRGIDVVDVASGPSWSLTAEAVEGVARTVVTAAADGRHDGVVVTHGTDTIEETAFLTWLLGGAAASEGCPIVFTGAMRHAEHTVADGPNNLRAALEVADGGGAPGPVVCLGGEVLHARWARKSDTSSPGSFRAVGAGAPDPPPSPPPHVDRVRSGVAEVHSHTGVPAATLDGLLESGAPGVVVVGTGAGNVHGALVPGIERALAAGVPVVVTSRCWSGAVAPEYGGPGGGRTLADLGCILAGDLPTNKARLALSVSLGVDPALDAVRVWFGGLLGAPS